MNFRFDKARKMIKVDIKGGEFVDKDKEEEF